MIGTFEALVVIVALLPGASYTWAFELQAGRRGANFSDRVWRFAGASTVFVSLAMPLLYLGYRKLVVTNHLVRVRHFLGGRGHRHPRTSSCPG